MKRKKLFAGGCFDLFAHMSCHCLMRPCPANSQMKVCSRGNAMKNNAVCDARSQSSFGFPTRAAWLFGFGVKKSTAEIY
jgi:hypothetical protein